MILGESATMVWQDQLNAVLLGGERQIVRGLGITERIGPRMHIDMHYPVVGVLTRNTPGYMTFLPAEANWILSGSSLLGDITPYAASMSKYSDNEYVLQGAYGPRVVEQLSYVIDCFRYDIYTRRAVIEIWRPMPRDSVDIPCTLSLQLLHRGGRLHCVASMRSSDLWLGFPFDVFTFTMITTWILLHLKFRDLLPPVVDVGSLILNVGSQHIYLRDLPNASIAASSTEYGEYRAMSIYDLKHPDDLLAHLRMLAKGRYDNLDWKFLREMGDWK